METRNAENWAQHGDVKITEIAELPEKARNVTPSNSRIVLMEGEVTGHAHAIEEVGEVQLFTAEQILYLLVPEGETAIVTHEEHLPATIPPGVWEIGAVEEHDYATNEMRRVVD